MRPNGDKTMSESTNNQTETASPSLSNMGSSVNTNAKPEKNGLLSKLRTIFFRDTSNLRQSLEEVIDQHDSDQGDALVRPEARSMMLNLLRFPDIRVDDIMVPRADIIAIEDDANIAALTEMFTQAGHSRIPVFHGTLDDPRGMIHIKDLMAWMSLGNQKVLAKKAVNSAKSNAKSAPKKSAKADQKSVISDTTLMREVLFAPPSMPAADLLAKMQSTHIHLAIVVDEYGGTDGLVSFEDIVEEIVGDIADEHDGDEDFIVETPNGNYMADARAPIEDVEAVLNIDLLPDEQDEDTDTLGGFVFSMLGRVPVRGELVRHSSGIEFEVVQADARRIYKLKIHTLNNEATSKSDNKELPISR